MGDIPVLTFLHYSLQVSEVAKFLLYSIIKNQKLSIKLSAFTLAINVYLCYYSFCYEQMPTRGIQSNISVDSVQI